MFSPIATPIDTLNYMIAGYVVIFLMILAYVTSLAIRLKIARKEHERLVK